MSFDATVAVVPSGVILLLSWKYRRTFLFGWSIALNHGCPRHPPTKSTLGARNGLDSCPAPSYLYFETSFPTIRNAFLERVVALETAWWLALGFSTLPWSKGKPDYSLDL